MFFSFSFSPALDCIWLLFCVRHTCVLSLYGPRRQHYIEYLVNLINKNNVDPVSAYEGSELIAQLRRMALDIPERLENETDAEFYGRCAQVNLHDTHFHTQDAFTSLT